VYMLILHLLMVRYIVSRKTKELVDDDVAEGSTNHIAAAGVGSSADRIGRGAEGNSAPAEGNEPDARDGGGAQRNKRGKGKDDREKKKKGSNKGRRWNKVHDDLNLCWRLAAGRTCEFGEE
jgi:tRNA-dihydrouridine synthase 3